MSTPASRRLLFQATGLALAVFALLACDANSRPKEAAQPDDKDELLEKIYSGYGQIQPGMTLAEVEALIGPGMTAPPGTGVSPPDVTVPGGRPQFVRYWNYISSVPSVVVQGCSLTVSFYANDNTVANVSDQHLYPE
ncbi:MAG: hypothetical protein V2A74_08485 [bacterium]